MMPMKNKTRLLLAALLVSLAACSSAPKNEVKIADRSKTDAVAATSSNTGAAPKITPNLPKANSGKGGYYLDDGPGDDIPPDLEATPDPQPVVEPYSRTGNKPYQVFGKTYTPINDNTTPFVQRGVASWYGKKFHGKRTSSGEKYDMYKITAAHPTLPIPSYARVTNLANGKQIIVRINDRGPFHSNRIMDLSYTAALKLGYLGKGSSEVELERLLPDDIAKMAENRQNHIAQVEQSPAQILPLSRSAMEKERALVEKLPPEPDKKISAVGNYYLQFAAFALRANAEATMAQLQQRLQAQLVGTAFEIVEQGSLYRLQSGPFASHGDALNLAEQIASRGVKAIVLQR